MRHPNDYNITTLDTLDDIQSAIASSKDKYVAIDTETTGFRWMAGDRAFGTALAWDDQAVFLRNNDYGVENIGRLLSDVYKLEHKTIVMHNAEFDLHMIRETYGVDTLPANLTDTLRVAYLLNTGKDHSLKGWGSSIYGASMSLGEDVIKEYRRKYKIKDYSMIPSTILDPYACMDAAMTKTLAEDYAKKAQRAAPRWFEYEHRLIPIIVDISKNGIKIDLEYIDQYTRELKRKRHAVHEKIFRKVGKGIKPGSPQDLAKYFYSRMKVYFDVFDNVESPESTKEATLSVIKTKTEEFPEAAEVASLVLEWRTLDKQITTYLENYTALHVNGYIHANFNACGTRTGRLSGSNPNIQNIPRDGNIRRAFLPSEGKLYDFDYSQLEYRLAGISSSEPFIVDAYLSGIDFHEVTATNVFDIVIEQVTKEQRFIGKTVNFLSLYGGGDKRLATELNIGVERAAEYLTNYWAGMPYLRSFNRSLMQEAERYGYVTTRLGRKIHISDRYYAAPNYVIQGTGGDMIKLSLIRVHKLLEGTGAKIRNTVHDSIIIDGLDESLIPDIRQAMEAYTFRSEKLNCTMPILIDIKECEENWGDGYEWTAEELAMGRRI